MVEIGMAWKAGAFVTARETATSLRGIRQNAFISATTGIATADPAAGIDYVGIVAGFIPIVGSFYTFGVAMDCQFS